jgi:hypothetical protein
MTPAASGESEERFLAHCLGRLVAAPNDAPFIAGVTLACFAASSGDKASRARSMRKPGSAATPPEYWNWWLIKWYPPAGKG